MQVEMLAYILYASLKYTECRWVCYLYQVSDIYESMKRSKYTINAASLSLCFSALACKSAKSRFPSGWT